MEFVIKKAPHRLWAPVNLRQTGSDGTENSAEVELLFEVPTQAEYESEFNEQAILAELQNVAADPELEQAGRVVEKLNRFRAEVIEKIIKRTKDWRGFVGPNGAPVKFTVPRLREVMAYRHISEAVAAAFHDTVQGRRRGN